MKNFRTYFRTNCTDKISSKCDICVVKFLKCSLLQLNNPQHCIDYFELGGLVSIVSYTMGVRDIAPEP